MRVALRVAVSIARARARAALTRLTRDDLPLAAAVAAPLAVTLGGVGGLAVLCAGAAFVAPHAWPVYLNVNKTAN